jgi:hypothetical protein
MWVGFKCNGLIVFSQRGGASKVYNTCVPAFPPSPPHLPTSSPWFPPPSSHTPLAPLLLGETSLALVLWQGCSLKEKGDSSVMTAQLSYLMDQSCGRILAERRSQEMTSSDPAPFPAPLVSLIQGHGDKGKGGAKLGLHVVPHTLN